LCLQWRLVRILLHVASEDGHMTQWQEHSLQFWPISISTNNVCCGTEWLYPNKLGESIELFQAVSLVHCTYIVDVRTIVWLSLIQYRNNAHILHSAVLQLHQTPQHSNLDCSFNHDYEY